MPLDEYNRKRDFGKTSEPKGEEKSSEQGNIFVIQKHQARNLHYDLRIELDGVLKSWAVPKEPSQKEGIKRLAIQTEDHPLDYAGFEGEIAKGEYGAGTVEIWDNGTYDLEEKKEDKLLFNLHGKKMKGNFALIRLKNDPKNWLFFRMKG